MSGEALRTAIATGGCQCGAVRYALFAAPSKTAICHCRMCQKAAGAPFGVFAVVDAKDFAWTRGKPLSWQSSNRVARDFCGACGTPLACRPLDKPVMELMTGSLDEPQKAPPTYAVGRESKLEWVDHIGKLPSQTTLENMGPDRLATIVNYQHPDHD